jgi:hypothetical protein
MLLEGRPQANFGGLLLGPSVHQFSSRIVAPVVHVVARQDPAAVVDDTDSLGRPVAVGRLRPEEAIIPFVVAHEDVYREFRQTFLGDWNTDVVGVERAIVTQPS